MNRILAYYALPAALIAGLQFFLFLPDENGQLSFNQPFLRQYGGTILVALLLVLAIYRYRQSQGGQGMSLGRGFALALYFSLIVGVSYALAWELYFQNFAPDFMEQYQQHQEEELRATGLSEAQIEAQLMGQDEMSERYRSSFFFRFLLSTLEIFPLLLFLGFLAALILKRRPQSEAAEMP